jgi:TM2 domain-containing membrane protein YozV
MLCPFCREEIKKGAVKCKHCGSMLQGAPGSAVSAAGGSTPAAHTGKNKLAAALFGILLGGLGIHKFYLGQVIWGVVYLLFCWTFIPAIIGLIEGIVYLTMSDEAFSAKYNTPR